MTQSMHAARSSMAALTVAIATAGYAMSALGQTAPSEPMAKVKVAMEAAFARADANVDGKLSQDEAVQFPAISAKFAELDKNRDGFLTLAEFAVGYTAAS